MAINPLQQPINYTAQMVDLGPSFRSAGEAFQQLGQTYNDQAKNEAAKVAKQQFASDLQTAQNTGTQAGWLEMIGKYPQFREAFGDVRKGVGEERVKNEFNQGFEISNALENNAPEVAIDRVKTIIQAKSNSGESTKIYDDVLTQLEAGNIKGAQNGVNFALIAIDPDRFEKGVKAKSTAAEAPASLRAKLADADKKEADALIAQEQAITEGEKQTAALRLAQAQAEKEAVQAEFARTNQVLDVQQKGLQLGLTQGQINQAKAATAAYNAAAKKDGAAEKLALKQADEIASGIIPIEKRPEAEAKFRKEYSDQTKGYQDVKSAYGRILAVSDPKTEDEEAAADLALIFNFMKMQDTQSTVNTGEFANAQNATGVPDRVKNLWNNLLTGGRLNSTQRKAFRGQAENLYKVAGQQEDIVRKGIGRIAKGYGLDSKNIFYTETDVAPTALKSPSGSSSVSGSVTPAKNITVDY